MVFLLSVDLVSSKMLKRTMGRLRKGNFREKKRLAETVIDQVQRFKTPHHFMRFMVKKCLSRSEMSLPFRCYEWQTVMMRLKQIPSGGRMCMAHCKEIESVEMQLGWSANQRVEKGEWWQVLLSSQLASTFEETLADPMSEKVLIRSTSAIHFLSLFSAFGSVSIAICQHSWHHLTIGVPCPDSRSHSSCQSGGLSSGSGTCLGSLMVEVWLKHGDVV